MNANEVLIAKKNYKKNNPHVVVKLEGGKEQTVFGATVNDGGRLMLKTLGIKGDDVPVVSTAYNEDGSTAATPVGFTLDYSLDHQERLVKPGRIVYVRHSSIRPVDEEARRIYSVIESVI